MTLEDAAETDLVVNGRIGHVLRLSDLGVALEVLHGSVDACHETTKRHQRFSRTYTPTSAPAAPRAKGVE